MSEIKKKLMVFAKLGTLFVYCSPAILALIIFVFKSYKEKTEEVAQEIKDKVVLVASIDDIKKSSLWKNIEDSKEKIVLKDILAHFENRKNNEEDFGTFLILNSTLQKAGVPDSIWSKLDSLKVQGAKNFNKKLQEALGNTLQDSLNFEKYREAIIKYSKFEGPTATEIDRKVRGVRIVNMIIISFMVLLPYLALGYRLAFGSDEKIHLSARERFEKAVSHWPMKFVIAVIITIGWIYVVNPLGRGATTMKAYLISENFLTLSQTLPIYISPESVSHVVAGFIGWYLYLVAYFFRKLFHHDVFGTRVYRVFFGKFLFTYGAALVLSSLTQETDTKLALFLIGFFPLSAVSIMKQYGQKAGKGAGMGSASLGDLLSIEAKNLLRLEEEGIDTITTLANTDSNYIKKHLPEILRNDIVEWIDKAQLYAVLGAESYAKVSKVCRTATEFLRKYEDPEFRTNLIGNKEVENPDEIAHVIRRRFKDKLIEKPGHGVSGQGTIAQGATGEATPEDAVIEEATNDSTTEVATTEEPVTGEVTTEETPSQGPKPNSESDSEDPKSKSFFRRLLDRNS